MKNALTTAVLTMAVFLSPLSSADGVKDQSSPWTAFKIGQSVSPLAGLDLSSKSVSVDYRHHDYTLLSFFFSTCAGCIVEVPNLNRFASRHKNVHVIGVTFDSPTDAQTFVKKHGIHYDVIADAKPFIDTAHIAVYPTLLLIDNKSHLVAVTLSATGTNKKGETVNMIEPWFAYQMKPHSLPYWTNSP